MSNRKKRDSIKFPGLTKGVNSKVKQEYMDQDYINALSDSEKKFLSDFNEEFYGGNFQHSGKKFHRSKKARKSCYDRNNARNRCLYGLKKAGGLVLDQETPAEMPMELNPSSVEDTLIEIIDGDLTFVKKLEK